MEQLYEKKIRTHVFFFKYCKTFRKSFFYRAFSVAASRHLHYFSKFRAETISYRGPQIWNLTPKRLRALETLNKFKKEIKKMEV